MKKNTLIFLFIILISFLYIFEYTILGQPLSGMKYIIMMGLLIVIPYGSGILTFPINTISIAMVFCFAVIPLVQTVTQFNVDIGVYTVIMWAFLLCTYQCGKAIANSAKRVWFVEVFAVCAILTIAACFVLNYSNLFNVSRILSNFGAELGIYESVIRERSAFGFLHPNTIGGICLAVVICITMTYSKSEDRIKKIIRIIATLFVFLILLNSGSRSSMYSLVIYTAVLVVLKQYGKLSPVLRFFMRVLIILVSAVIALVVLAVIENDFELVNRITSYRLENWIYVFSKMEKDRCLLFGYGLYSPGSFQEQSFSHGMLIDNWFVYMITNIGFVGFTGCLIIVFSMFRKLWLLSSEKNDMAQKVLALFAANLFHAMAETAFITPSDPGSFLMMVLFFSLNRP